MKVYKLEKLEGLRLFQKHNLPCLPFEILDMDIFEDQINNFMAANKVSRFMIRTDGSGRCSPSINNATLEKNSIEIKELLCSNKTVFIMHPANIHRNFHGINIMKDGNEIIIETVGPGFLTTDLCRYGHLHEQLTLNSKNLDISHRREFLSPDEYQREVANKVSKYNLQDLQKDNSYLLSHSEYVPLSEEELSYIINSLPKLELIAKYIKSVNFVASMCFVDLGDGTNQPLFWDIYGLK